MKTNHCRMSAILLAGLLLFLTGCSSTEFYTVKEMMEMDSKDFNLGGKIKMKDLGKYRIVYPYSADEAELELVHKFRDAVAEKTGVTLEIVSDMAGLTDGGIEMNKYEIVLGGSYRPENNALLENYCAGAEGWDVIGKRLYIYKSSYDFSDNGMDSVVESFISEVVDPLSPDDPVFFDSRTDAYVKKNSVTEQLILNGRPVTEYDIVTSYAATWDAPRELAENLQRRLSEICGDRIPIVAYDGVDENEDRGRIFVGGDQFGQEILERKFRELFSSLDDAAVSAGTEWCLESAGDSIWLDGSSSYALMESIDAFLELVMPPEEGMPVYEAVLPAGPVTGEVSEKIELLHIDFAEQPHDSWAMERYASEYHPDLLVTEDLADLLLEESGIDDSLQPYYTCIGKWGEIFLYCTDRFEVQAEIAFVYDDYVCLYDRGTGKVFALADMTRTEESELPDVPMIRADFRKDEPLEWEGVTIFACEDVTEEVSGYLGQENMSACLYELTIEE